jgi:hypothetical protein
VLGEHPTPPSRRLEEADDGAGEPLLHPSATYSFAREKIRQVAYTEAGRARRRVLHRRALEVLEGTEASGWTSAGSSTRVRPGSSGGLTPGRLHDVPRRDLADPAQLGREGLSQPHLLQRGGQGRPLRGLGGAATLLRRGSRGVQLTALVGGRQRAQRVPAVYPRHTRQHRYEANWRATSDPRDARRSRQSALVVFIHPTS